MKNVIVLLSIFMSLNVLAKEGNPAIYVEVTGQGAPVMLIPGFTVPSEGWDAVVEHLEKNYECHVVTLAGFGGKPAIEFPWLPQVNDALQDYINNNSLEGLSIIGHSLGGTVATWLASQEPRMVSKLILVDALPAAGALMMPNFDADALVYESPYNDQMLAMSNAEFAQMATTMSQGMSLNESAQEKIKNWMLASDRKTYVYGYTDYLKLDMRKGLKKIVADVTIFAADRPYGKEIVIQTMKNQYENLEEYELIVAENSAHFIMFDQANWFIKQIQQILVSK